MKLQKSLFFISTLLLTLSLIAGIAAFIALGTQTRYIADDYCYAAKLNREGFINTQLNSYFGSVPYSGNRYALTFFVDLFDLLSIQFLPFIPVVLIMLFLSGLFCLSIQLFNHVSTQINKTWFIFIVAAVVAFTTLYLAPNRFQVIIWMNGSFTYFLPIIVNIWLLYFYLKPSKNTRIGYYAWIGLLGLISAGFSEIVAVVQAVLWFSIFLFNFFNRKQKKELFLRSTLVFLFTCLAILILILCPNNYERQTHHGPPNSIINVIKYGPVFAFDFIIITLRSYYIPFIILFAFALLIPQIFIDSFEILSKKGYLKNSPLILTCAIGLAGFILIWVSMLPTLYALQSYPDPRGLFPATFILIMTVFSTGLILGFQIKKIYPKISKGNIFLSVLIFCLSIYFFHAAFSIFQDFPRYASRAQKWDERHAIILSEKSKGESNLIVPALDSFDQMIELQRYTGHWVNMCAADWYAVDAISAVEKYDFYSSIVLVEKTTNKKASY